MRSVTGRGAARAYSHGMDYVYPQDVPSTVWILDADVLPAYRVERIELWPEEQEDCQSVGDV